MKVITNVRDLNYYRLNTEYKKIKDESVELKKALYDLDMMKIRLEKLVLENNEKLRKCESQILTDLELRKN